MRTPRIMPQVDDGGGDSSGRKGAIIPETRAVRVAGDDRTVLFPQVGKAMVEPEQVNNAHHNSGDDMVKAVALDGFLLLDTCRVEFPEEATRADVNGLNIRSVVVDDLLFFSNLVFLDMSDNQAPFEPLGTLPALKELDFQCNAVHRIQNLTGFDGLEWLNLSFNCLTSSDVEELAKLPKLRELYLSNNSITTLPPIMDRFVRLETLSLERNNIQGTGVFTLLAVTPRLKNLNLCHNKLVEFPESALCLQEKQNTGFANLAYLNLAHNKVTRECDILPLVKLRALQQLVIYGNPLAHAAVQTQDKTKLVYNPVPDMTDAHIDIVRDVELNIVVAYPETKKKKSTYKNVQIARVAQAALPTSFEFKARAQRMLFSPMDQQQTTIFPRLEKKEMPDTKPSDMSTPVGPDATFMTSLDGQSSTPVLRQDKFPHVKDHRHMENEVPSYFLARSLAPTTEVQQHKLKTAMTSLRYQLNHPLTSHNDMDVMTDVHAARPNCIHKMRQRRKRHDGVDRVTSGGMLDPTTRVFHDGL
ncbi:hypothetical protein H310_04999 [Aphanomyces invadans]|uniref:Uncharacterized protein n=1 Tax=Aphanomyces invadans TaxID=157072 RepID=A0A024UD83_9STRA|nr:hypothetical protein H310_04999 [Aphanomyces invadans]ETW03588.1 hypothetical protein H310_04999 [Aphanomyces invadans]|eukprot:XP_008867817.1 hypothetical protein H310_04999 [Aphanomyces invadans]